MKIFYDPTECRENTRLPPNVINAGVSLPGLEALTGADLLISPLSEPALTAITEALPTQLAFRQHCAAGALIQRKTGRDFTSSISKLDDILARMQAWGTISWLLIIGELRYNGKGECIIDGHNTHYAWSHVTGALNYWQVRGGYYTLLSADDQVAPFLSLLTNMLSEVCREKDKVLLPRKPRQHVTRLQDREGHEERIASAIETLVTFPRVGPKLAQEIAARYGSLAWSLVMLSQPDAHKVMKVSGFGPETARGVRNHLGLDDYADGARDYLCHANTAPDGHPLQAAAKDWTKRLKKAFPHIDECDLKTIAELILPDATA